MKETDTGDIVTCSNCEFSGEVARGADTCPNCGRCGVLAWTAERVAPDTPIAGMGVPYTGEPSGSYNPCDKPTEPVEKFLSFHRFHREEKENYFGSTFDMYLGESGAVYRNDLDSEEWAKWEAVPLMVPKEDVPTLTTERRAQFEYLRSAETFVAVAYSRECIARLVALNIVRDRLDKDETVGDDEVDALTDKIVPYLTNEICNTFIDAMQEWSQNVGIDQAELIAAFEVIPQGIREIA